MNQVLSPELSERVRRLSDESLVIVLDAFREGRNATAHDLARYCQALLTELEQQHDALTPDMMERFDATYRESVSPPLVAAYFGASADIVERFKDELRRLGWREQA